MRSRPLQNLGFALLAIVLVSLGGCAGQNPRTWDPRDSQSLDYFVSPAGNDAWSGRSPQPNATHRDGPFRTLQRAQLALRQLKTRGPLTAPVTIRIRAGTYEIPAPLVFTPEDSGTSRFPVTWTAYPGETVIISGGTRLTNLQTDPRGRWFADLSTVLPKSPPLRQIFVNGQRCYRPRLPRTGFFHVKAPLYRDRPYGTPTNYIEFDEGQLRADWTNLSDIEVEVLHFWVDTRLPIRSIDPTARIARFTVASQRRFTDDHRPDSPASRYWVENVFEALDQPGQFYHDRPAARLYYVPRPGENPATAAVVVSRMPQVVRFLGDPQAGRWVEHVRLQGLTFAHTEWTLPPDTAGDEQAAVSVPGAIELIGARSCAIQDCTLEHLGTYAIDIGDGCRDVNIIANHMHDLGGGGVKISGGEANSPEPARTRNITVTDNRIHDGGAVWRSAVGILLRHAADCLVAHNEVCDLNYTGISVGWVWGYKPSVAVNNRIEFNHVHNIGRGVLADMGGIYTLGPSPGTVVRNNVVHDVVPHGDGAVGLYADEGSTGILFENNLVYRTKNANASQHYGKENIFRNNILAFGRDAQIQRAVDELHLTVTFERNIVYWNSGKLLTGNFWSTNFRFDHNLYWDARRQPIVFFKDSFEAWQKRGHDVHSLIADPLFEDPARDDFRLKPDSPALRLGFKPFDTRMVGPRKRP